MRQTLIIGFFLSLLSSGLALIGGLEMGAQRKEKYYGYWEEEGAQKRCFWTPGFVSKLHMHRCGPNQHGSDPKQNFKLKIDQHPGSRLSTGWAAHAVQIQTALQRLWNLHWHKQKKTGCNLQPEPINTDSMIKTNIQLSLGVHEGLVSSSWQMPKSMDAQVPYI